MNKQSDRKMGAGSGKGKMGGLGRGPGGNCVCPQCHTKAAHERGIPCFNKKCPNCGATMTREG